MAAVCHCDGPPMPSVGLLEGILFTEGQIYCAYLVVKWPGEMHQVACNVLFLK